MTYLAAAVIIVGLLCILDLLLTFGVIRRLREHTRLLTQQLSGMTNIQPLMLPAGATVGEFAARTSDGEIVTRDGLAEETLVGFFSPSCGPCKAELPHFIEAAQDLPGRRDRVLAVVVAGENGSEELAESLAGVARVILDDPEGPVCTAFGVNGFPAFGVVAAGGRLHTTATTVDKLAMPAVL